MEQLTALFAWETKKRKLGNSTRFAVESLVSRMRIARPKSLLARNAGADLWLHTLTQIPALSGRLVYLSMLRSPITGHYEHHGLSLLYGECEADKAIRSSHRNVFQEWLAMGLPEKVDDIERYLRSTREDPAEILRYWSRPETWRQFVPSACVAAERALFRSDLRNVLMIVNPRFGAAAPDQTA